MATYSLRLMSLNRIDKEQEEYCQRDSREKSVGERFYEPDRKVACESII